MKALGVFLLLECCLFASYLALRTVPTRFHSRVLLAAMVGIVVIAIDRDRLSLPFIFWSAVSVCWIAGIILTASEMLGRLADASLDQAKPLTGLRQTDR
ncbi:MAG: hypothetical protein ACXWVL_05295 [Rhodoplanes sp.]